MDRAGDIALDVGRDHVVEADPMQHAVGDAVGEAVALHGEQRHAGPERVQRGGRGVEGEGIEEEPDMAVAGEMLGLVGQPVGEDEARRIDAALFGLAAQGLAVAGHALHLGDPEHAARHGIQDPHPGVEGGAVELLRIVEGAEDEGVFRQAAIGAARRFFGDRRGRGDVIALGQPDDLLLVEVLLAPRHDDVVGDQIVDEGKPQPPGMPHPIDLHGAGAEDHDRRARRLHIAVEIDQDVDAQVADAPGGLQMRQVAEVVVVVDAVAMALVVVGIAAAPGMGGDGMDLEALAVMVGEELQA